MFQRQNVLRSMQVGWESFADFWADDENRSVTYATVTVVSLIAALLRSVYIGNALVLWVLACCVVWVFFLFFKTHEDKLDATERKHRIWFIRSFETVSVVASIAICCITHSSQTWVIPSTGQTSLSTTYFFTPPFFTPEHYALGWNNTVSTDIAVRVSRASGVVDIPAKCQVSANNVVFDDRDVQGLEKFWLAVAQTRNPSTQMYSETVSALASATEAVIAGKTLQEIAGQRQYELPYDIGTGLGDTLARNHLHWKEGYVLITCELAHFNN